MTVEGTQDQGTRDQGAGDKAQGPAPDVVAEARRYGWRPKDQYNGREEWVDADEFVRRGRESIPILRAKIEAGEGRISKLQAELGQVAKDAQGAKEIGYKLATQEWKEKYDTLLAEKVAAKQDGDAAKEVQVEEELAAHKEAKPAKPEPAKDTSSSAGDGEMPPEHKAWFDSNQWYFDPKLRRRANVIGAELIQEAIDRNEKPLMGPALYEAVKEAMIEAWPEDMGVAAGGAGITHRAQRRTNAGGSGGRTYNDLPPEAKKACDRFVARKMCTQDEYLKTYDWD